MNGSMMTTISIAEVEMPRLGLVKKKIGTPAAAASAKQMSWRFVRLNMTFVLTRFRSFGTGTNAIGNLLSKRDAAFDFVSPNIPAFGGLSGKKFDARDIAHELDDAVAGFLRFFGVLFNVAYDDLMHARACPFGMAFRCKDAEFGVCPCPIAHAPKEAVGHPVLLNPDKSRRFIFKSPCFEDLERLLHTGEGDPHEERTVFRCKLSNGQSLDLFKAHGRVMAFRRAAKTFL